METYSPAEYAHMLDAIKSFVSNKLGIEKALLTEHTKIEEDVGIAGLDTYTFYENYFDEFPIINPEDFLIDKYTTSENLDLGLLIKGIFSARIREKMRVRNVTLGHLTQVALTKKWFEE